MRVPALCPQRDSFSTMVMEGGTSQDVKWLMKTYARTGLITEYYAVPQADILSCINEQALPSDGE